MNDALVAYRKGKKYGTCKLTQQVEKVKPCINPKRSSDSRFIHSQVQEIKAYEFYRTNILISLSTVEKY